MNVILLRRLSFQGDIKELTFRVIQDDKKHVVASNLLCQRYAWRGYGSSHSIPAGEHHTTFAAEMNGRVVATVTLTLDSPDGLAIDRTFEHEANQARRSGARLCELTKLAVDPTLRSKEVLAALFHLAFIHGTSRSDCTDLLIEVHPRHAGFYEVMLGFERVGTPLRNASVGVASQLLRIEVAAICRSIQALGSEGRSLYAHFQTSSKREAA